MIPKHVLEKICKVGQGLDCCRYVGSGENGIECLKVDEKFKKIVDKRVKDGKFTAISDNCRGLVFKSYRKWEGDLKDYLNIDDYVDQEMADYFINVLPPRTMNSKLIQMGEPYSHVNGRATYATLEKDNIAWRYCGNCYAGQSTEPKEEENA